MLVSIKVFKYGIPFSSVSILQPSGVACAEQKARETKAAGEAGDWAGWRQQLVGGSSH